MSTGERNRRRLVRPRPFTLALLSVWFLVPASAGQARGAAPANYDCGTLALYTLFRVEGRRVDLHGLESALPTPPPSGFSMQQLRYAASSLGVQLTAVRLPASGSWDRPALVFTRRGPHGHFFVLRPIGHTGKLVQVIDSLGDPDVVDISDIVKSPEWTGLALIPPPANWPARIGWVLLCGAAAVGIVTRLLSWLRGAAGPGAVAE